MTPTARASSVLLLATALLLTGCDEPVVAAAPSAPPPEVKIVRAEAQSEPDALTFTARLEAVHDVDLRPRVSGPIVRLAFREGDHVAAGAPLFEVDPRPYVARRDRARADSARARAALKLAEQELARARSRGPGDLTDLLMTRGEQRLRDRGRRRLLMNARLTTLPLLALLASCDWLTSCETGASMPRYALEPPRRRPRWSGPPAAWS